MLERIRELDPQFDEGEIARVAAQMEAQSAAGVATALDVATTRRGFGSQAAPAPGPAAALAGISALAGSMAAHEAQQAVPDSVREFQSPGRAQAFVVALLLSKEPAVRQRQFALLQQKLSAGNFAFVQQIAPTVDSIDPMQRLPALQQVFPALRRVPVAQRKALAALAAELIYADARIDAFEFSWRSCWNLCYAMSWKPACRTAL